MARTFLRVFCLVVLFSLIPPAAMAQANEPAAKDAASAQGAATAQDTASSPAGQQPATTTPPKKQKKEKGSGTGSALSSDTRDRVNPMPSLWGYPGLWQAVGAGGLPARSFGATGWIDRINRNPGFLTITTIGTSGFLSFNHRFALDYQVNINRRILVRRADQLSLGQQELTLLNKGGCPEPNCLPRNLLPVALVPGTIMPRLHDPHTGLSSNTAGFYNQYPWAQAIAQNGVGEVVLGGNVNLVDFTDTRHVAIGVRPYVFIPTRYKEANLQSSGAQTGSFQYGADLLLEAHAGASAGFYANAGYRHVSDPKSGSTSLFQLRDMVPTVFGMNIPRTSRVQLMLEYTAAFFVGDGTRDDGQGTATDGTLGLRLYPANWLSFSGGYRHTLNHSQYGGDKNGFVVQVSVSYIPTPKVQAPIPPTVTCAAEPTAVALGEPVRLTATASTTSSGTLTYTWATTAGRVEGSGPTARLDTTGVGPGTYGVTVRVDDGMGGFADCTVQVTVKPPPPPPPPPKPPTATCSVDRRTVAPGEVVTVRADASSPDNRPLNYDWTVTGGRITGSGPTVRWDTTGLSAGSYTATMRVTDDRGLSADCAATITVQPPPPAPKAAKLNECKFKARLGRVDNVCKAVLDDVALRLQNEPGSRAVTIGSQAAPAAKKGRAAKAVPNLDVERASNVKAYLVREKGIDAGRIDVRTVGDSDTVEIWLVPQGANMADVPGNPAAEKMPPVAKKRPAHPRKKAATEAAPESTATPAPAGQKKTGAKKAPATTP